MAKLFIDTSDQDRFIRDEIGYEFESEQAAKTAAIDALPDMARDELPDGDARSFSAIVRDQRGRPVLQASLTLRVMSMVPTETR
jgi:hypothetical protein